MKSRAVVFDFDGTIADAEGVMLRVYAPLAEQYNWPKLTRKDYFRLKKSSPMEIMRWADIKLWQLPKLLRIGRAEYKKHAREIKLFAGMPQVIKKLSIDHDIYVLSSNDRSTVVDILRTNGFDSNIRILQGSPIFGKDKALNKLLKARSPKDCWMIGDEIRDVEAGKKTGMRTIGVTWGLQSRGGIKKADPDFIASKPDDILKFIYNDS